MRLGYPCVVAKSARMARRHLDRMPDSYAVRFAANQGFATTDGSGSVMLLHGSARPAAAPPGPRHATTPQSRRCAHAGAARRRAGAPPSASRRAGRTASPPENATIRHHILPRQTTRRRRMTIYTGPVFEMARDQFQVIADHLEIPADERERLLYPKRAVAVACPIHRDDGSLAVFHGYRVQHHLTLRPHQGRHAVLRRPEHRRSRRAGDLDELEMRADQPALWRRQGRRRRRSARACRGTSWRTCPAATCRR